MEHIEAEIEVDEDHVDEAINHMVKSKQVTNIKHQVMDKELEAEVEAEVDFNKEINLRYNVIIAINMAIVVKSVDQIQRWRREIM